MPGHTNPPRAEQVPTRPLRATRPGDSAASSTREAIACLDTRILPALKALPTGTRNTLRQPAATTVRQPVAHDGWASSGRWRVPDRLPALPGTPARQVARQRAAVNVAGTATHPTYARVTIVPGTGYAPPALVRQQRIPPLTGFVVAVCLLAALVGAVRLAASAGRTPASAAVLAQDANQGFNSVWTVQPSGSLAAVAGSVPWEAGTSAAQVLGVGGASKPAGASAAEATATTPPAATPVPTARPAVAPPAVTPAAPAATRPAAPPPAPAKPAVPSPAPPPPAPAAPGGGSVLPAPVSPWPPADSWMAVPGHQPYAVRDWAGDPMAAAFGQCTWWAQATRRSENLRGLGNARYWAGNAPARGLRVGYTPVVDATVVFQPWVQGAGKDGHVAHVLALYPGGWFLISEMNSYGNGGGWGRVSFRYVHTGPGVAFIY